MSQHLWISSDESIEWENRSWITNRNIFESIFDRVKLFFEPSESTCQEACYFDWGMEGIELSYVDKTCFNIFYSHCKTALEHYPDEKEMEYQMIIADRRGTHEQVVWEWTEILKRLQLDKRYDAIWLENYWAARV